MKPVDLYGSWRATAIPARGIVIGKSQDGKQAVAAYFIMGRSVNSRTAFLRRSPTASAPKPPTPPKWRTPASSSTIRCGRSAGGSSSPTGYQTDTIRDFLEKGLPFEQALRTREFEPDGPNWTPRISGLLSPDGSYKLSILKAADEAGTGCLRQTFEYPGQAGLGHFLHTYRCDGSPIPSFEGGAHPGPHRGGHRRLHPGRVGKT